MELIERKVMQFQSPSILGWSISTMLKRKNTQLSFSPLRYWGGLYLRVGGNVLESLVLVPFDIGVVYIDSRQHGLQQLKFQSPSILGWSISYFFSCINQLSVLVPFDIGVVYINKHRIYEIEIGFSPLRYWGGLYQYGVMS